MRVRVYDKTTNSFFYSEVYAQINRGWYEKQLIRVPHETGDYLRFFDYLDKEQRPAKVLINGMTPERPASWIQKKSESVDTKLPEYADLLKDDVRFFDFCGFPWIYDNVASLTKLLNGESIFVKGSIFEKQLIDTRLVDWNYIETQNDIDKLMRETSGFHDSIIKSLHYTSGGYVSSDRSMHAIDDQRKITLRIDSQISQPLEIVFEGVTALNLRPAQDNYTSDIFHASLFTKDCTVFFCDDSVSAFDTSYSGTWITAYCMRWRFL